MKSKLSAGRIVQFLSGLIVLLSVPYGYAQTVSGSMAGSVSNPSSAVIPNAKVQAVNEGTGAAYTTVTSAEGVYRFPVLPIGAYDVSVTASELQTKRSAGVRVNLQVTTGLDIKLKVGAATQSVTINASAPQLQTESSET